MNNKHKKQKITKEDFEKYTGGEDSWGVFPDNEENTKFTDDPVFETGQIYEDHAVFKIKCNKCDGDSFKVGHHSYLTVVKCVNCGIESIIQDG
jgi:hypothetical protein